MSHTDAIVVGAGVIGASCAVELARAGLSVTLIDRGPGPGAGSTSRATGGFRAQYATAVNIRLSLLARDRLRAFRDDTGVDPGFVPVGYLWLADDRSQLAELAAANALQRRTGLDDAVMLGTSDIRAINPFIDLTATGVVGGAWCPSDGVMRPSEILRGYLETAQRLGVEIRWGEPVVALPRTADRITAVVTPRASYPAGLVVNAAGAWAAPLAQLAGIELAIAPLRRQVAITMPTTALPERFPMTIWVGDGFHLRVRDGRVLLLRPTPGDPAEPWSTAVEPAWLDDIAGRTHTRIPALRGVALDRAAAWAGLYEMSPDHHAVLGWAPACPNLLLVNGSSGHGVMHSPALGVLAAEIATTGAARSLDVHALRPSRFAERDPVIGSALL